VAIDYGPLRGTTARELISALVRDGFAFGRGSGSHQIIATTMDAERPSHSMVPATHSRRKHSNR
jgi:predicted RNA binding protein YcfA (HicA-like mRNA interferase family)